MHTHFDTCIKACDDCAAACDHCAVACLAEADPKPMARCVALDLDCAALCRLASAAMARGSQFAREICALCAQICEECGNECGKHPVGHCQACAEACRNCARECRDMAGQAGRSSLGDAFTRANPPEPVSGHAPGYDSGQF